MSESVGFSIYLQDLASKGLNTFQQNGQNAFGKVDSAINNTEKKLDNLGGGFSKFKGLAVGALAGIGFASLAKDMFTVGSEAEQTRIAFDTLLQSEEKSLVLRGKLQKFADVSPFNTSEVMEAGQALLGFGVNANGLVDTMNFLGEASKGNSNAFKSLVDNYGKMTAAQRATTMDLNQFATAGIPIWSELGKVIGLQGQDLRKYVELNGVGMETIDQIFKGLNSEGGMFFGMMEKQSQSTAGLWSTLSSKFEAFGVRTFNAMQPAINGVIGFATIIADNQPLVEAVGVGIGIAATAWGVYTIHSTRGGNAGNLGGGWRLSGTYGGYVGKSICLNRWCEIYE